MTNNEIKSIYSFYKKMGSLTLNEHLVRANYASYDRVEGDLMRPKPLISLLVLYQEFLEFNTAELVNIKSYSFFKKCFFRIAFHETRRQTLRKDGVSMVRCFPKGGVSFTIFLKRDESYSYFEDTFSVYDGGCYNTENEFNLEVKYLSLFEHKVCVIINNYDSSNDFSRASDLTQGNPFEFKVLDFRLFDSGAILSELDYSLCTDSEGVYELLSFDTYEEMGSYLDEYLS